MKGEKLIKLCQQGDARAQKCLYDAYATPMFRLCLRYIRNQGEAEDTFIKGFHKVLANINQLLYRDDKSLDGWIKKIMVNECLMVLRKSNNFHLTSISNDLELPADFSLDSNLSAEAIYALVLELPTGYRTVFNLYVLEGYSHKEIATQLEISELTSRSQLSKAKAMLRELLTKNNLKYAI
ncbi:DNA-directed RNA polymerase sigma-70 factor [Adhaeribacter aerolatus]|uniref:DNA-directed RNA polymerase sigma-70 factor n=1 Tax=Adhaeribacter aerolatus TaxID=670289 RepID=A0A512B0X7_9BACT|nr:sigma-70 family RNA polymerase sigma factor [Adhaeribacter aerolatus]GEO05618.1 DNA-directed RNA polymerase sigma-70 factor [Adhaeribacter aerolatus]